MKIMHKPRIYGDSGQAAVELVFSVLVLLLLILASAQILYTSLISHEAVRRAHADTLAYFHKMNRNGSDMKAEVKELFGRVSGVPGGAYGHVVNTWSLFHKEYQPDKKPHARYGEGTKYESIRGITIGAGPLKGPGGEIDSPGEGRSAFGVTMLPMSDGQGYNMSGMATRNDAFKSFCKELGIRDTYFR